MKRRTFLHQQALSAAALAAGSALALGSAAVQAQGGFVEGRDFRRLANPAPVPGHGKIDVVEFFWYGCPHCFAFEPALSDWARKRADQIVFKRIPVGFRESFVPQQKLYFALEALNRFDVHKAYFDALHIGRQRLDKE